MMRNWSWLLISFAAAAHAEPPRQLEIAFTMSRNGSPMAEVVERLEYGQGNYKLTETWKGKGIYALLGSARRVSQGSLDDSSLRPREFFDERSGRDTARAWFDWNAKTLTMQYKSRSASEPRTVLVIIPRFRPFSLSRVDGQECHARVRAPQVRNCLVLEQSSSAALLRTGWL